MEQQWKVSGGWATERVVRLNANDDRLNLNANGNLNNQRPALGIASCMLRACDEDIYSSF